jgi:hypothetical protein
MVSISHWGMFSLFPEWRDEPVRSVWAWNNPYWGSQVGWLGGEFDR